MGDCPSHNHTFNDNDPDALASPELGLTGSGGHLPVTPSVGQSLRVLNVTHRPVTPSALLTMSSACATHCTKVKEGRPCPSTLDIPPPSLLNFMLAETAECPGDEKASTTMNRLCF